MREVEHLEIFLKLLLKVENSFSDPYQVTYKKLDEMNAADEEKLSVDHDKKLDGSNVDGIDDKQNCNEDIEMKDETANHD